MQESFLTFKGLRYLWVSLILLVGSLVAYVWHNPSDGPNGGTWLGYTLGGIGAALILWLMLFGYRKRTYRNNVGSLRGWLSAHVYLGTCLIFIATLHTGFQFGWNVHTIAYVLMVVVIVSGFFGVFAYLRYPTLMTQNRANTSRESMLEEIAELDDESVRLADKLGPKVHQMVLRSIGRTRLGGGVMDQLFARDGAQGAVDETKRMLDNLEKKQDRPETAEMPTMFAMVDFLAGAGGQESERLRQLLDVLHRKKALASKVAKDVQYQALMDIWLYFHVPITFALIGALTAHVVSVFFYW
ncbi:MAG: hypothetical protein QNJ40_02290 [Xanthomonadales bacterium]|nr:hypothetical protein [Xanthomonadales bacterium]